MTFPFIFGDENQQFVPDDNLGSGTANTTGGTTAGAGGTGEDITNRATTRCCGPSTGYTCVDIAGEICPRGSGECSVAGERCLPQTATTTPTPTATPTSTPTSTVTPTPTPTLTPTPTQECTNKIFPPVFVRCDGTTAIFSDACTEFKYPQNSICLPTPTPPRTSTPTPTPPRTSTPTPTPQCTNEFIRCDGNNGLYYSGTRSVFGGCATIYVANDARCFLPPTPTPTPPPPPTVPPPPPPTPTPTPTPTWRSCVDGSLNNGVPPTNYRISLYPGAGGGACWEPLSRISFEPELNTSLSFLYKRGTSQYPSAVTVKATNPSYATAYRVTFNTNPDINIEPKIFTLSPRSTQPVIINITPALYEKLGDGLSTIGLDIEISEV